MSQTGGGGMAKIMHDAANKFDGRESKHAT